MRRCECRLEADGAAVALDRLFVALQRRERIADVVVRFGEFRVEFERSLETRNRPSEW